MLVAIGIAWTIDGVSGQRLMLQHQQANSHLDGDASPLGEFDEEAGRQAGSFCTTSPFAHPPAVHLHSTFCTNPQLCTTLPLQSPPSVHPVDFRLIHSFVSTADAHALTLGKTCQECNACHGIMISSYACICISTIVSIVIVVIAIGFWAAAMQILEGRGGVCATLPNVCMAPAPSAYTLRVRLSIYSVTVH